VWCIASKFLSSLSLSIHYFIGSTHTGVGRVGGGEVPGPFGCVRSRRCLPLAVVVGWGGWVGALWL
jgi:hypothetical protein